jgi:hypothetical protein
MNGGLLQYVGEKRAERREGENKREREKERWRDVRERK